MPHQASILGRGKFSRFAHAWLIEQLKRKASWSIDSARKLAQA